MEEKVINEILKRLGRLEKAVFTSGAKKAVKPENEQFAGPSGGIKLLISNGFFKAKRNLAQVKDALAKEDYHYTSAPVQTALNRLSIRTGPLAASKEGGNKVYVKRK